MVRRCRTLVASVLTLALLGGAAGDASAELRRAVTRKVTSACAAASESAIERALGVSQRSYVGGPTVFERNTCSWRSVEPNCFLRSVSVRVHSGSAARDIARASDTALALSRDFRLGNGAFYRSEDLPPGSAVMMEHLFVNSGSSWLEYSILGRLDMGGARSLLHQLAASASA